MRIELFFVKMYLLQFSFFFRKYFYRRNHKMSRVELINFSDFVNVLSSTNPLEVNYLHIHIASRSASLRQSFFFQIQQKQVGREKCFQARKFEEVLGLRFARKSDVVIFYVKVIIGKFNFSAIFDGFWDLLHSVVPGLGPRTGLD